VICPKLEYFQVTVLGALIMLDGMHR